MRGFAPIGVVAALAAVLAGAGPPVATPASQLVAALNDTIRWYRQQRAETTLATDPSDVVYADAVRRQSRATLQLAFEYARAEAALQPAHAAPAGGGRAGPDSQAIARRAADAAKAADDAQANVRALERRREGATGRRLLTLDREVAEARSELALAQARRDTLRTFADFVTQQGGAIASGGLLGQIDELERSVPEIAAPSAAAAPTGPASPAPAAAVALRRATPSGVVAITGELLSLGGRLSALRDGEALTGDLRGTLDKLRAPLVADARATLQQGDALAREPDTVDPSTLQARTAQISGLVDHFRKVSAALVPLGKAGVLLRATEVTLTEWRAAVDAQYDAALRALALRLALLAVAIAIVLAASAFWRYATFRYVRDARRRQQSLVARRIVVSIALALVIALSFVTEVGSVATFAGFITAGLAVALQNVIVSVVAYFFLIGKYGVRVGDRVQISGVTGDVVDIGLVRLHLLEVGEDGLRTGRVVVFSNAVLFQPTANFFKQIPGSSLAWHQLTLTLSPDTDYRYAESRIVGAVDGIYSEYAPRLAQEHDRMAQTLSLSVELPRPHSHLRLTDTGLEMTIRFPVPLDRATEIDDRMTRALVEAIGREPRLKLTGAGTPTLQAIPAPAAT